MISARQASSFRAERGSSLVEFSIIGGTLLTLGLFILQIGLLYHAKSTVNYAVFEAARVGAVNNASLAAMRNELGRRLAPLEGGDGSARKAAAATVKSMLRVADSVNTRIEILNPTRNAFSDWAVTDDVTGRRVIPVNHLRHQSYSVGALSGLSLRDATLLKLMVTHGVELRVPVAGKLMTNAMTLLDPNNAEFYLRGKWPLQSVAIVRMQSDAFEEEILNGTETSAVGSSTPGTGADNNESHASDMPQLENVTDVVDSNEPGAAENDSDQISTDDAVASIDDNAYIEGEESEDVQADDAHPEVSFDPELHEPEPHSPELDTPELDSPPTEVVHLCDPEADATQFPFPNPEGSNATSPIGPATAFELQTLTSLAAANRDGRHGLISTSSFREAVTGER